jgi:thioredoxin 1
MSVSIDDLKQLNVDVPAGADEGIFLVDVYTEWCGPCKFVAPILHKLSDEGLFSLTQVDLDQNRPLGEKFGITAIPTLLFFKDGKLLEGTVSYGGRDFIKNGIMVGAAQEEVLRELIKQIK